MKNKSIFILATVIGWLFFIAGGLFLIFANSQANPMIFGGVLLTVGIPTLIYAGHSDTSIRLSNWRSIAEMAPNIQRSVLKVAQRFGELKTIQNVIFPQVVSSHTRHVQILGLDATGTQVLVGVDPTKMEAVKAYSLCPENEIDTTEGSVDEEEALMTCMNYLEDHSLTIPDKFEPETAHTISGGTAKRWRFIWKHQEEGVTVRPDFLMMEVKDSDQPEVVAYAKVEHPVEVNLSPKLTVIKALSYAYDQVANAQYLEFRGGTLSVVYPNNLFDNQVGEWSEKQALAWVLRFANESNPAMEVWIDAVNGKLLGGERFHLHTPEVYNADNLGKLNVGTQFTKIWEPILGTMKFDVHKGALAYEQSLLAYLAQGYHLPNAHSLAEADTRPIYPITVANNTSKLNHLAPLLISVDKSPGRSVVEGDTFKVEAEVVNREDVDFTPATDVQANLVLPTGFTIVSGANPQRLGTLTWNSQQTATWKVKAPTASGKYDLDVEVKAKNLDVAVDDMGNPNHTFDVEVIPLWLQRVTFLGRILGKFFPDLREIKKIGGRSRPIKRTTGGRGKRPWKMQPT